MFGRLVSRSADTFHEQPAREQGLVADHLGRQPEPRAAGEKPVVGISGEGLRGRLPSLPVGRREHDRLEDRLNVPAAIDEFAGQMIDQFGMRG